MVSPAGTGKVSWHETFTEREGGRGEGGREEENILSTLLQTTRTSWNKKVAYKREIKKQYLLRILIKDTKDY